MIPNIDILTEEITDEEHPNETYKISGGTEVITEKVTEHLAHLSAGKYSLGMSVLSDISPTEPTIDIQLSSDTVSDFTGGLVVIFHKNLLRMDKIDTNSETSFISKKDDVYTLTYTPDKVESVKIPLSSGYSYLDDKTYTFSFNLLSTDCLQNSLCLKVVSWKKNKYVDDYYTFDTKKGKHAITFKSIDNIYQIWLVQKNCGKGVSVISDVQLEVGEQPTTYDNPSGFGLYDREFIELKSDSTGHFTIDSHLSTLYVLNAREHDFKCSLDISYTKKYSKSVTTCNSYIDELDAVKQAIYLILSTERYEFPIYSWDYGVELIDLYGKPMPYVMSELPRRITEALTQDNRIDDVIDFEFEKNGKKLHTTFTVVTNAGNVYTGLEVDV